MPDTSTRWEELVALDAPMTKQFWLGYGAVGDQRRASMIPSLFNVQGSDTATEKSFGVGTLGSDGWEDFERAGRVPYGSVNKGWEVVYEHREFARGVVVERKLIDDNNTRIAFGNANQLGDSAFRKREKDAASVFNNAFSTSHRGPDGRPLVATDHPFSAEDSSTYSNKGTSALTADTVGASRVDMGKFTDDTGDIMDVTADLLIVPPELEDAAFKLTRSGLDPDSANNAVNPQAGRFRYAVWHYLTDANNWFMAEQRRMRQFLNWFERVPLEFAAEQDFDTLMRRYRAYMRYSFGFDDARWLIGHEVA